MEHNSCQWSCRGFASHVRVCHSVPSLYWSSHHHHNMKAPTVFNWCYFIIHLDHKAALHLCRTLLITHMCDSLFYMAIFMAGWGSESFSVQALIRPFMTPFCTNDIFPVLIWRLVKPKDHKITASFPTIIFTRLVSTSITLFLLVGQDEDETHRERRNWRTGGSTSIIIRSINLQRFIKKGRVAQNWKIMDILVLYKYSYIHM